MRILRVYPSERFDSQSGEAGVQHVFTRKYAPSRSRWGSSWLRLFQYPVRSRRSLTFIRRRGGGVALASNGLPAGLVWASKCSAGRLMGLDSPRKKLCLRIPDENLAEIFLA